MFFSLEVTVASFHGQIVRSQIIPSCCQSVSLNLEEREGRLFWLLGLKNEVQYVNVSNASVSARGLKTCEKFWLQYILWDDLTIKWNDLDWNNLTMEQSDQIPTEYGPCRSDLKILPAIP